MHVLILPSELYCPPRLPLHGIFQRHQAEILANHGVQTGVASFGYIPWRYAFGRFPYSGLEGSGGLTVIRDFVRPLVPARFAYGSFRKRYVARFVSLVGDYIRRFGAPDLVHAHNTFNAGLVAARVSRTHHIPFVLTEHSSAFQETLLSGEDCDDIREVFGSAAAVTAVSTALAERMMKIAPAAGVTVLANVLEPAIERQARAFTPGAALDRGTFRLLFIGGLTPVKDPSLLIRSFARAFKMQAEVRLRIGGDGPLQGPLMREADALGVASRVEFLGSLTRDEVVREIRACDALIVSSIVETFGVVAIEALAFGKPVVSTKCGGPEDIVTAECGLLVERNDDSMAAGMAAVRNVSFDAAAIQRHCLAMYGAGAYWRRVDRVYGAALGGTSARRTAVPGGMNR